MVPASPTRRALLSLAPLSFAIVSPLARAYDNSFDYTSFQTGFGQAQFDVLNYPSINGNFMMTSTDNHRGEMNANGNELAQFYNNFLADYNTQYPNLNAAAQADKINQYSITNSTKNGGPKPQWLILNEISSSVWQDATQKGVDYRNWVIDCVTRLKDVHGFTVITYSPYATASTARAADWQRLAGKSYIGIENYLSGAEVMNGGSDYASRVAWAQAQYQASKNTYTAAGVPFEKLFLGEHFASTVAGTGWGRSGISASDWDTVIQIRQDAIRNVGFPGFLAYNHGGNGMGITQAEQIQHEYYYRSKLVLPGQQPQWLSDSEINVNGTVIPLSWGEFLNWKGGIPNAAGAIANFYRTNTAARTITLDAARTVGTLSFNSPSTYTLAPGSGGGGSLTLSNGVGGGGSHVSVVQGSHVIAAGVTMIDNALFNIAAGSLLLDGGLGNPSGRKLTKSGAGTLTIGGTQLHAASATIDALAGTTNFSSSGGANLTINAGATVNFTASQHLKALTISPGVQVTLTPGDAKTLSLASLATGGGTLDLSDNDLIIRNGGVAKYAAIASDIAAAYDFSAWTGPGILTSRPDAAAGLTTLGVGLASHICFISGSETAIWNGQTVSPDDVLIMYTYAGDADLNGYIDAVDYGTVDQWIQFPGTNGYGNGDFNYDGVIDAVDYGIIDNSIQLQREPLGTPGNAAMSALAVPEPSVCGFAILAAVALRRRRQRRS